MDIEQLQPGDTVYAASHIYNDGGIPEIADELNVQNVLKTLKRVNVLSSKLVENHLLKS